MSLSYNYPPQIAYPSAPPVYRAFPPPPRLHWAWVLVLSIVTLGLFWNVWLVVQAWWVKKATGKNRPFAWALAYTLSLPVIIALAIVASVVFYMTKRGDFISDLTAQLSDLSRVVAILLYLASVFLLKSALESAPISIPLHGLGALFFGPIYFQYYLHDYIVEGKTGEQVSGFEEADAPPRS